MTETQARSSQQSSNSKRRILIVDDEPSIVNLLAETLRQEGYACSGCQSGKEAMRLMNTEQFDVILSDVHMPGMSGLECVKELRETGLQPPMKVMMVTTEADNSYICQALDYGADEFLMKPFTPESLREKLAMIGLAA